MKFTDEYLLSNDIDWFFSINDVYIHVASAGGIIPEQINDKEKLRSIQRKVFNLPYIFNKEEIIFNEIFLNSRFGNQIYEQQRTYYLRSFTDMAMKGFISMDRTNFSDFDDNRYHIVCMPKRFEQIEGLQEIFKIEHREQTFYEPTSNINLLELF